MKETFEKLGSNKNIHKQKQTTLQWWLHISHLGAMGSSLPAVTNDGNDGDLEVTELANCAEKPGENKDVKSRLLQDIQNGIQMGNVPVIFYWK